MCWLFFRSWSFWFGKFLYCSLHRLFSPWADSLDCTDGFSAECKRFCISPCPLSSDLWHGTGLVMRSIASSLHRTSTKRGQSFLTASRVGTPRQRTRVVQGLTVVMASVVRPFERASFWSVASHPPLALLHFCVVVKVLLPDVLSPATAVFWARVIPTDYVCSRLPQRPAFEVTVVPGVQRPLLLAHWLST